MQYLLGLARPEDQSSLEERLVTDGEFYEEFLMAEDELVDQYLNGDLSDSERERFENHFLLLPERQSKLRFGRAFNKLAGTIELAPAVAAVDEDFSEQARDVPKPPPKPRVFSILHIRNPVVGFALAAAVLVILFGSAWMIVKNWSQPEPHDILTEVLTPGSTTRGDDRREVRKFSIPSGKGIVRLELELVREDYQVYRAVLQDAAASVVMEQNGLHAKRTSGRSAVVLDVPVGKLRANSYQVKLKGITGSGDEESVASYYFTVSQ